MKDKNDKEVVNGSVINLHQTVNGQNIFVVFDIEKLDIRYGHDLTYKYQYDVKDLFKPCQYSGEVDFEIVNNIYKLINKAEEL